LTAAGTRLRCVPSADLTDDDVGRIRALLEAAFDDPANPSERFAEEDWRHALGGTHAFLELDGAVVAHASVVERDLRVGGRPLRTGYVEAVGTARESQGRGFGTTVMEAIGAIIRDRFELGALGTGAHHFYERLGWRVWPGPTSVRTPEGEVRTPLEDGDILVLLTPATPPLDEGATLSCDWRPGDVW
jgi:aminoglycoside 2'-N-acetyltransferase I